MKILFCTALWLGVIGLETSLGQAVSSLPASPTTTAPAAAQPSVPPATPPEVAPIPDFEAGLMENEEVAPLPGQPPPPPVFPLPKWTEAEEQALRLGQRQASLGRGLFSNALFPLPPQGILSDRLTWDVMTSAQPLPPEFFTSPPSSLVVDPQGIMPAPLKNQLCQLLGQLAQGGAETLWLLVMPAGARLDATPESWPASWKKANEVPIIAFWPMGEPAAAKLLAPAGALPPDGLKSVLAEAKKRSEAMPTPTTQLSQFALHTVLGLRSVPLISVPVVTSTTPTEEPGTTVATQSAMTQATEDTPMRRHLWWIVSGLLVIAGLWLWRRRSRERTVHTFPDSEMAVRLGAPHSGGTGAALSWE